MVDFTINLNDIEAIGIVLLAEFALNRKTGNDYMEAMTNTKCSYECFLGR